jgi:mono/diheme cytochrome c family protein
MKTSLVLPLIAISLGLTGCAPSTDAPVKTANSASAQPAATSAAKANLANGQAVFVRVCAVCHQANGQGVPGVFPPLAGSPIVDGDPKLLIRLVLHGLQGPIEVNGKTYNSVMPGQGPLLKDHEIANALSYVRNSWGHAASPVSADDVAAIRASEKRTTMWTWAELTAASK